MILVEFSEVRTGMDPLNIIELTRFETQKDTSV